MLVLSDPGTGAPESVLQAQPSPRGPSAGGLHALPRIIRTLRLLAGKLPSSGPRRFRAPSPRVGTLVRGCSRDSAVCCAARGVAYSGALSASIFDDVSDLVGRIFREYGALMQKRATRRTRRGTESSALR